MVVSLSQNMLSPAHYEDWIDNVKKQGNTVSQRVMVVHRGAPGKKKEAAEAHQTEAEISQSKRAHADKENFLFSQNIRSSFR